MTRHTSGKGGPGSAAAGFATHHNSICVEDVISAAEAHCAREGLRFTPVRRQTLEILLREHRALGAYEVLDHLHLAGFGSQPPVAYRALDFLTTNGFAHKIERLNAFIASACPGRAHSPAFLICRECDAVSETQSSPAQGALGQAAKAAGFVIERTVVEAEGLCPTCAGKTHR